MNIFVQDTTENLEKYTALTFTSNAEDQEFSKNLQDTLHVYKFAGKTGQVVTAAVALPAKALSNRSTEK